jgi:2-aminoadipate transaminase
VKPGHSFLALPEPTRGLRPKLDVLMEALNEQFGTSAEFEDKSHC